VRTAATPKRFDAGPYMLATLAVGVALGLGELIRPWLGIENVDLVFLTAIVTVAARFGLRPSLFASVAASLCYNFFFLPPLYTFTIGDPNNVAAFVFFIVLAMIVSKVAARVRSQAFAAISRPGPPRRSTPSAASSPAPVRWTTSFGRPPIRQR
jgi:two-component system sensor histidine kinase KdpD